MALKDMLAKARATATQHRGTIDQGITKLGEVANTRTGGRYQDQIRKGSDHARAGLDKIKSDRPDTDRPDTDRPDTDRPDTDGPASGTPGSR
ncbi:Rv0909 family putative TA system antitoxin [Ornithinimicrobium sediminis]|uniref:Rv0909 family putative TA system antitoxin n=1 Tax=Ornithinimicrobium sediminis TaxID=2904603 RepID=UPI001E639639|nr:Rv0909 family putative TA system antitoxin [Ornithinimicrobium sediminis]MCE0487272.1 antitoxin [Ornithinimicrobium sediminis]